MKKLHFEIKIVSDFYPEFCLDTHWSAHLTTYELRKEAVAIPAMGEEGSTFRK